MSEGHRFARLVCKLAVSYEPNAKHKDRHDHFALDRYLFLHFYAFIKLAKYTKIVVVLCRVVNVSEKDP